MVHYQYGELGFPDQSCPVLLCIAHDRGVRLRDVAASLGITERSAHSIVTDLTAAGYVVKQKDGRPLPAGPGCTLSGPELVGADQHLRVAGSA